MTGPPDFRDLVGDDVPDEELELLRRAHELLVSAGPPPELSPSLARPPEVGGRLLSLPRRRRSALLLIAAALVAGLFGVGFLVGSLQNSSFSTQFSLTMKGTAAAPAALASIAVGHVDSSGNWPLLMRIRGLRQLPPKGYYVLWLSRKGRPIALCGIFRVHGGTTTVRMNAPYTLRQFDGWVVTASMPNSAEHGPVLLETV